VDRPGAALALRSHYFEFQHADGACKLAHELDRGGRYRVILTTAGGLYRYQLRDEVEIVGFENQCPLLRFVGKADRISDRVGEKLAEPHVRQVLERLFATHQLTPHFALLTPVDGQPARYRLYLQGPNLDDRSSFLYTLQADLERGLRENPHYRHAVRLGQLAPVELEVLDPQAEPGAYVYERHCLAQGQKAGDIKAAVLDAGTGWADEFRPLQVR
jgi:hypothetical protein